MLTRVKHDARIWRRTDREDLSVSSTNCRENDAIPTICAIVAVKMGTSMFKNLARCALLSFSLLSCSAVAEPIKPSLETVRVGGTGATNELVNSLGVLFAAETGITLELIPNLGTGGGNNAVADGVLDLCISGRPLNAAEVAKGLRAVTEIHAPFAMVTSHPNPNGFKSAEIARLYQSDKPVWADGTPIRIILRPTNESDTWALGQMFPGMSAAIAKVRSRSDLSIAATDQDNADMAEKIRGSLVGATITQIKMEKRNLRFVAIDGVEPSLENYEKRTYPFGKSLYFVVTAKTSAAGERFLTFVRSAKGAAALRDAGVLLSTE
jgi:phosphate transport system substrate-binding protein